MAAQEEVTELLGGIVEDTDVKTSVNDYYEGIIY